MEVTKEFIPKNEDEKIIEIELERLRSFKNHPFQVKDDKEIYLLKESIEKYGILNPLIVRPVPDGVYEIISGHRRKHAAELLGYRKVPVIIRVMTEDEYEMISGHRRMHAAAIAGLETIPAIVRELSDDDAVIAMVDANIQREELLPSEKGFAYKMKLDAMKRQGVRNDLTLCQNGTKYRTDVVIAEQVGESARNVQRYIRLTELRKQLEEGSVNQGFMISIFNSCIAVKTPERKVVLSGKKFTKYFPDDYSETDMEKVIEALLEQWKREQE